MNGLIEEIKKFVEERNWTQFHSPENLAKSISIEAGELLECFQWDGNNFDLDEVREELAEVFIYCAQLSIALDLDLIEITKDKMKKNALKYPVSKAYNKSDKYTKL
ncbi:TPA: nucleotide pyrophosphohydrolase [bacterium]|nr:nucleotide pyrophosphohydrolase [bacterium]